MAKYGVRTGTEARPYVGTHSTELGIHVFGVVSGLWGSPNHRCCRVSLFVALFRRGSLRPMSLLIVPLLNKLTF